MNKSPRVHHKLEKQLSFAIFLIIAYSEAISTKYNVEINLIYTIVFDYTII